MGYAIDPPWNIKPNKDLSPRWPLSVSEWVIVSTSFMKAFPVWDFWVVVQEISQLEVTAALQAKLGLEGKLGLGGGTLRFWPQLPPSPQPKTSNLNQWNHLSTFSSLPLSTSPPTWTKKMTRRQNRNVISTKKMTRNNQHLNQGNTFGGQLWAGCLWYHLHK